MYVVNLFFSCERNPVNYIIDEFDTPSSPALELLYPIEKQRTWNTISISAGIILVLTGGYLWSQNVYIEEASVGFIVAYIGLIVLGFSVAGGNQAGMPQKLVFQNKSGRLQVIQNVWDSDDQTCYIPYTAIRRFHVSRHVSTSTSGSGSNTRSRTTITYHAEMHKCDGATWTLGKYSSREEADKFVHHLRSRVELTHSSTKKEAPSLPLFDVTKRNSETIIRWKKRSNFPSTLPFLLIGGGIALFAFSMPFPTIFRVLLVGFFGGIIGLLPLLSVLSSLGAHQVVHITEKELSSYVEGGFAQGKFALPLSEITGVVFNVDPNVIDSSIQIQRAEELKQMIETVQGSVKLGNLWNLATSRKVIDGGSLTCHERVALEQLIQDALTRHGHQLSEENKDLLEKYHQAISQDNSQEEREKREDKEYI